jgi:ribosomal protein S18 acetylase RimI-like enzyme
MDIRIMVTGDYERVYALWLRTPGMGLNMVDDSKEGIEKYLMRNPNTCFVAEKDGDIIGVILSGHDGRRGYIYHTAVDRENCRQGVGAALVNAVIAALNREGITRSALLIFTNNDKGGAFWEKQGFTVRNDIDYRDRVITELTNSNFWLYGRDCGIILP